VNLNGFILVLIPWKL